MQMNSKKSLGLLVVAGLMFVAQLALAQANRGKITGTVTDASEAIVPGVEVTATNKGTNVQTKAISNNDGIYVIPNLPPGTYSVEFKREGFETLQRPSITLESTEAARIDEARGVRFPIYPCSREKPYHPRGGSRLWSVFV